MSARVRVEESGGLLEIVLSAAGRGNALDLRTAEEFAEAAGSVDREGVTSVLVRAEGRNFCVGGDLRDFARRAGQTEAHVKAVAEVAHQAVTVLAGARVPVVCAVQGAAAGAGVGIALCADIVVAATTAKFRLAYTAVGLSPDCGGTWFLPRIVGPRRALDLALTNRVLTAEEALSWGLVTRVVEPDVLAAEAKHLAGSLGGAEFAETKRLIREATGRDLGAHLDDEAETIAEMSGRAEAQLAIQAFVAR